MKLLQAASFMSVMMILKIAVTAGRADERDRLWYGDLDQAQAAARSTGRPLMVLVTAPNCPYCLRMQSDTLSNSDVVTELETSFIAVKVDGSQQRRAARKLGIRSYPTTIIMDSDSHVLKTVSGYIEPQPLRDYLHAAAHSN